MEWQSCSENDQKCGWHGGMTRERAPENSVNDCGRREATKRDNVAKCKVDLEEVEFIRAYSRALKDPHIKQSHGGL